MNTQKQDEIIEFVGAESWDDVVETFGGKTFPEIKEILDDTFLFDDNSELAQMIFDEVGSD